MERANRLVVLGIAVGGMWIISGICVLAHAPIRVFLMSWLAAGVSTLLVGIWIFGERWFNSSDHYSVASFKAQVRLTRLAKAMDEEEEADLRATDQYRRHRRLGSVV